MSAHIEDMIVRRGSQYQFMKLVTSSAGGEKHDKIGLPIQGWVQPVSSGRRARLATLELNVTHVIYMASNPGELKDGDIVEGEVAGITKRLSVVSEVEDVAGMGRLFQVFLEG